jgi:hypothetical protein
MSDRISSSFAFTFVPSQTEDKEKSATGRTGLQIASQGVQIKSLKQETCANEFAPTESLFFASFFLCVFAI